MITDRLFSLYSPMNVVFDNQVANIVQKQGKLKKKKKTKQKKKQAWIQGDPNQSFPFQMAVTLKLSSPDPMLVKPKCVWEVAVFFEKL